MWKRPKKRVKVITFNSLFWPSLHLRNRNEGNQIKRRGTVNCRHQSRREAIKTQQLNFQGTRLRLPWKLVFCLKKQKQLHIWLHSGFGREMKQKTRNESRDTCRETKLSSINMTVTSSEKCATLKMWQLYCYIFSSMWCAVSSKWLSDKVRECGLYTFLHH